MPNPQCMTDIGDNAQAWAYPVSDARDPRPSSAKNGQGLPSGGLGRLKKLVRERGRGMRKVKIAKLNVGSMTGRSIEISQLMRKKSLQVVCVQETKWKGSKAREIGAGYKLYYHGEDSKRNGIGIVLCEELKEGVLVVTRPCDRVMRIKLEIEGEVWPIISCYAPQTGCPQDEKGSFHVRSTNGLRVTPPISMKVGTRACR